MVEKLGLEGPFGLYWRVSGGALSKKRQNVTEINNEGDEGDLEVDDLVAEDKGDEEVVVEDEAAIENDLEVEDELEVEEEVIVEEDIGVEDDLEVEEEVVVEDDLEVDEEMTVEEEIGVEDDLEVEVEEEDEGGNREEFEASDTELRVDEE
ncbi:hypothetical protein V6N13_056944 [Hibiscus sabdariffa]|uniref:Uncharacterized protein n=2 Tax=Hibiscus sabdariffa TaxID=183260 RepID=A0ABR2D467_9ROSI